LLRQLKAFSEREEEKSSESDKLQKLEHEVNVFMRNS